MFNALRLASQAVDADLGQQFAPRIRRLGPGQAIEVVTLDRMHQPARLSVGGDQVIPAARRHLVRAVEAGDTRRDGIGTMEVVQQPAVESVFLQRALDCINGQRHSLSIASAGWSLRRQRSGGSC